MNIFLILSFLLTVTAASIIPARTPTLVTTQWLNEYLKQNPVPGRDVRVLEASFNPDQVQNYTADYLSGHIPHATFFDLDKCVQGTTLIPRELPELNCLTNYIRNLGVWPDTHVIVYARTSAYKAFRTWWLFRLYGHKQVSVLDGGLRKWTTDGFNINPIIQTIQRSDITMTLDRSLMRTYEDMVANVLSQREQVIDARSPNVIAGTPNGGMIPGANFVPYSELFNTDGTMKSASALRALFENGGVDLSRPMVVYCTSGMTATAVAGAAHILGKDIPVYYGSWIEWSQRAPEHLKQRVITNRHA